MNQRVDPALAAGNQSALAGYTAQHFKWQVAAGVGHLALSRPERKNPLTFESYAELRDLFHRLRHASDVHAVVLSGEGGNFCSGGDVHEIIGPLVRPTIDYRYPTRFNQRSIYSKYFSSCAICAWRTTLVEHPQTRC